MVDMDLIMTGNIPADQEIGTMREMYHDMMDMMTELSGMMDKNADTWMAVLEKTDLEYSGDYNWVWNDVGAQYKIETMYFTVIYSMIVKCLKLLDFDTFDIFYFCKVN